MEDLRNRVIQVLLQQAQEGLPVITVLSDSSSTSKISPMQEQFPERIINVGIAEQSLVSTAAGLALGGLIPYTANASPFLLTRSAEQLRNDVCYSNLNVKMLGLNAGVAYGPLGSTHHGIEDIGLLRSWGNVEIFAPADAAEAGAVVEYASRHKGPMYIRMDSEKLPILHSETFRFQVGEPVCYHRSSGKGILIFALGSLVHEAMAAVAQGLDATVVNLLSIRPCNWEAVLELIRQHQSVISIEEHSLQTGLASLLSSLMLQHGVLRRLVACGFDGFATADPRAVIRKTFQLDTEGIFANAKQLCQSS